MAYDEMLARRVAALLRDRSGFSERTLFGGVGYIFDGNMSCGVNGSDLMVRVGPDAYDAALAEPHVRVFDFTGRPMRGWVVVEAAGLTSEDALSAWVERGVEFARSLPAK